jgi:hypothetical protein
VQRYVDIHSPLIPTGLLILYVPCRRTAKVHRLAGRALLLMTGEIVPSESEETSVWDCKCHMNSQFAGFSLFVLGRICSTYVRAKCCMHARSLGIQEPWYYITYEAPGGSFIPFMFISTLFLYTRAHTDDVRMQCYMCGTKLSICLHRMRASSLRQTRFNNCLWLQCGSARCGVRSREGRPRELWQHSSTAFIQYR